MIRPLLLLVLILVAFSACQPILTSFAAPDSVVTGEVFEIEVVAGFTAQGGAAAVLQFPLGATILDSWVESLSPFARDDPAVLALFSAEPGMQLATFSASGASGVPSERLIVRMSAPATSGVMILKVTSAHHTGNGVWQRAAGQGASLSQLNDPLAIRSIDVVNAHRSDGNRWRDLSEELALPLDDADYSVEVGDLNDDGLDDLAIRGDSASGPSVFLRSIFGEWLPSSSGLTTGTGKMVFGDVNGDGNQDLLCASGELYLGDGQGAWAGQMPIPGFPGGVPALGDLNGDGRDDIISGDPLLDQVSVFYSQAGGAFSAPQLLLGPNPARIASDMVVCDFDGDGFGDLFLTRGISAQGQQPSFPATPPSLYLGSAAGLSAIEAPVNWLLANGRVPSSSRVRCEDLDGDGDPDLALYLHQLGSSTTGSAVNVISSALLLLENQSSPGQLSFIPHFGPLKLPALSPLFLTSVHAIDFTDINGDGDLDAVVGSVNVGFGPGQIPSIDLLRNDGAFNFSYASLGSGVLPTLPAAWDIACGDFDGDGLGDFCYRFDSFGFRVKKQIQDEDYCALGTVEGSLGAPVDVLLVNGQAGGANRSLAIPTSTPFNVQLAPATLTPNPRFIIWGELGPRDGRHYFPSPLGPLCLIPHPFQSVSATRFTLANSVGPDPLALLQPAPGAWFLPFTNGIQVPLVFTLQGVVQDLSSPTFGYSVTNAVTVAIQ